jgi:uroporphyrinogen decarboxylase
MTKRQKTFNAIKRISGDFVPYEFDMSAPLLQRFKKETGSDNPYDYYNITYRKVYIYPQKTPELYLKYYGNLKQGTQFDEFGVAYEPGDTAHFTYMRSPMKNFTSLAEYQSYPFPHPDKTFDWARFGKEVSELKAQDRVTVGCLAMTIFEQSWYLRGMEEFMLDMYEGEAPFVYLLDKMCQIRCKMAENMARAGVDVLHLGDDIATQNAMMISLDLYRKWIKPRHKAVIDAAKSVNKDIIIDYHSDGNCTDAIEDLIEIGVEILNPVQPECMDPIKIKERFGGRLSFRGAIGTQTTMPFGTPQDVRNEVTRIIENVGRGGGLILAPSHLLEPEVPWENVQAFISTVTEHNK